MKMGVILSSETFVIMYRTSPYHKGEYYNMNLCDSDNLSSHCEIYFIQKWTYPVFILQQLFIASLIKRLKIFIWRVNYRREILLQYILIYR
jgi:hypothetical protein